MKYAFTSFSCPELSLHELLGLARAVGYDGVELRVGLDHAHGVGLELGPAARAAVCATSAEHGVAICCLGTSCKYVPPEQAAQEVENTLRYIDLAADLGVPLVRIFGGVIPPGLSREAAADSIVASLRAVADHAAARGVTVVQESHDDWSAPAVLADLMQRVGRPEVGLIWDIMHTARHGAASMDAAYSALKPWIRHVHFHDSTMNREALEFLPLGEGALDNRRVVELLLRDGYSGYLSGEWLRWAIPYQIHLPRELATIKGYEQSAKQ
jgi:sugar phosphate isomerase/epimerase